MGAELWNKLKEAVLAVKPELANDFSKCRNRDDIVAFMNKNFPLDGKQVQQTDWHDHMSVKIPEMLREYFSA